MTLRCRCIALTAAVALLTGLAQAGQFAGRIAYSADGNQHDPDDWASAPMALAIMDAFGVKPQLVHFDYCDHLGDSDPFMEREMEHSVLGAAELFGYDPSKFHSCRRDLNSAIDSIKDAVLASSADNRLWFIVAGPMEIPYLGLKAAHDVDADKLRYVTCISHSPWNNTHVADYGHSRMSRTDQDIKNLGVKWEQIAGQKGLRPIRNVPETRMVSDFTAFSWLKDSKDARMNWLFGRLLKETKADVSDAGMAYYLLSSGKDQECSPRKLESLLVRGREPAGREVPPPHFNLFEEASSVVVWEAENFFSQDRLESHLWKIQLPEFPFEPIRPDSDDLKNTSHTSGASGNIFLEALPDTNTVAPSGGQMAVVSYRVFFRTAGTYYVWVRANVSGGSDNSIYTAIDGNWPPRNGWQHLESPRGQWGWSCVWQEGGTSIPGGARVTVDVQGWHTISFSMRGDGVEIDKFVLENSKSKMGAPLERGPAETLFSGTIARSEETAPRERIGLDRP